jgi:hypothetical protein
VILHPIRTAAVSSPPMLSRSYSAALATPLVLGSWVSTSASKVVRIGFHNCPGVDLTAGLVDIGLGIRWRLALSPSPPRTSLPQSPILHSPHLPPPQSPTSTASANASSKHIHSLAQTPHTGIIPTPILPSQRHARTPRVRRHPVPRAPHPRPPVCPRTMSFRRASRCALPAHAWCASAS